VSVRFRGGRRPFSPIRSRLKPWIFVMKTPTGGLIFIQIPECPVLIPEITWGVVLLPETAKTRWVISLCRILKIRVTGSRPNEFLQAISNTGKNSPCPRDLDGFPKAGGHAQVWLVSCPQTRTLERSFGRLTQRQFPLNSKKYIRRQIFRTWIFVFLTGLPRGWWCRF